MIFPEKIEIHISKLAYIIPLIFFFLSVILYLFRKNIHNKKIKNIIKSYEGGKLAQKDIPAKEIRESSKNQEIINYSLSDRKSGLTWGGGNIKGANAARGTKRQFLKKG